MLFTLAGNVETFLAGPFSFPALASRHAHAEHPES
jgi:hypothetical protein